MHLQTSLRSCSLLILLFLCLLPLLPGGQKPLFPFFFLFNTYFLLSHPVRDLNPDETAEKYRFVEKKYSSFLRTLVKLEVKHLLSVLQASSRLRTTSAPPDGDGGCGLTCVVNMAMWWNSPRPPCLTGTVRKKRLPSLENTGSWFCRTHSSLLKFYVRSS